MKKTLFALLACATLVAPAMADETPFENSFTLSVDNTDDKKIVATQTTGEDKDVTINSITSTTAMTTLNNYIVSEVTTEMPASPDEPVEGSNWSMFFNFKNATTGTMTITAFTLDVATQVWGVVPYFIYGENSEKLLQTNVGNGSYTSLTVNNPNIVLKAGDDYTFELRVLSSSGCGGVKSVKFSGTTPEPATATLSLLALAGLAARRRRRH